MRRKKKKANYAEIRRLERELGFTKADENDTGIAPGAAWVVPSHDDVRVLSLSSSNYKRDIYSNLFQNPPKKTVIYGPNGDPL